MSEIEDTSPRLSIPRGEDWLGAIGLVTSSPLGAPQLRSTAFGRCAPLLPLVGLGLGGTLAFFDSLIAAHSPRLLSTALVVGAWEALGRGKLRRAPSVSLALVACLIAAKIAALSILPLPRILPIAIAPMLGAWSVVVLAVGARDAANPSRKLSPGVLFNEFAAASLFTFAVVFGLAQGLGILIGVTAAAAIVGLRMVLHQRIGGVSEPWLVYASQLIELLALTLFVPFRT